MVLMDTYFHCCTLRLGGIVVCGLIMIRSIVFIASLFIYNIYLIDRFVATFENDLHYRANIVPQPLNFFGEDHRFLYGLAQCYNFSQLISCHFCLYGAVKLNNWFLVPTVALQFCHIISSAILHGVFVLSARKLVGMGMLIILSLTGNCYSLFEIYNTMALVALMQAISLVHSARYKAYYGDDPFEPQLSPPKVEYIQNVQMLSTPNDFDIDRQKRLHKKMVTKWWQATPLHGAFNVQPTVEITRNWHQAELLADILRRNALNRQWQ